MGMYADIVLHRYARIKRVGLYNLQIDDYGMVLAGACLPPFLLRCGVPPSKETANTIQGLYTGLIVCLNVIAQGGGSNLYPPEMEGTFTPDEIEDRIYGSKIVVVSEQAMLNVIYVIKAC